MAKREVLKALETKAFAQAYIDNGFNGTRAMLAVKPDLTEGSANALAAKKLAEINTIDAIENCMDSVKNSWSRAMNKAIAHTEQELDSTDMKVVQEAKRYLADVGKLFAIANNVPRTAIQNNRYVLPKR